MINETSKQDNFPKVLDPFLTEYFGKVIESQLIGEHYLKHSPQRKFEYAGTVITHDNAVPVIRKMLMESVYKTTAMNNGCIQFTMFLSKDIVGIDNGVEATRVRAGQMFTQLNLANPNG